MMDEYDELHILNGANGASLRSAAYLTCFHDEWRVVIIMAHVRATIVSIYDVDSVSQSWPIRSFTFAIVRVNNRYGSIVLTGSVTGLSAAVGGS
jgi:hypothetical protein